MSDACRGRRSQSHPDPRDPNVFGPHASSASVACRAQPPTQPGHSDVMADGALILLVRHGQTAANLSGVLQGQQDHPAQRDGPETGGVTGGWGAAHTSYARQIVRHAVRWVGGAQQGPSAARRRRRPRPRRRSATCRFRARAAARAQIGSVRGPRRAATAPFLAKRAGVGPISARDVGGWRRVVRETSTRARAPALVRLRRRTMARRSSW